MEIESKKNLAYGVLSLFCIVFVCLVSYIIYDRCVNGTERTLEYLAEANETYCDKMEECKIKGYEFIVDGTTLAEVPDEFITSSFGRYNMVYDDAGKQVIMTTLQSHPQTREHSYTTMPMFFWGSY